MQLSTTIHSDNTSRSPFIKWKDSLELIRSVIVFYERSESDELGTNTCGFVATAPRAEIYGHFYEIVSSRLKNNSFQCLYGNHACKYFIACSSSRSIKRPTNLLIRLLNKSLSFVLSIPNYTRQLIWQLILELAISAQTCLLLTGDSNQPFDYRVSLSRGSARTTGLLVQTNLSRIRTEQRSLAALNRKQTTLKGQHYEPKIRARFHLCT
jgi:hypothetical protein